MKSFLTSMLGTMAGLAIFAVVAAFLLVAGAGAFVAIAERHAAPGGPIEKGSYLVFDLSARLTDAPARFDFGVLPADQPSALQLRDVTRALKEAAGDPRIAGVLLKGSFTAGGIGEGYGALQEIRGALAAFRASGKPVKAYLEFASTKDYYVASAASEVIMDPYGLIFMPGLAAERPFFAGALEKYGVGVQVTRVGKYKSFVEPFVRKDMSPENREETQRLLDDLWAGILADVGRARAISPGRLQATVDSEGLIQADRAKAWHLVDRVAYRDELLDELKAETGRKGAGQPFKQIGIGEYARREPGPHDGAAGGWGRRNRVAIVYAEGDIVDGEGDDGEIGGAAYSRELRKLRQDDSVKAIVLRVNSPGGSATAAEEIQREVRLARRVKPVIVSMGAYAASGGYWISTYGDRIFAEPGTITGSIGVFGLLFNVQKLANDFGVTFDGVKTGKFADALTIARPKTPEEMAVLQRVVDWIYAEFVGKVAEGRGLKPEFVETIAQGRVWSGEEALKLGLVDERGGLEKAIAFAVKKAGLGRDYRVNEYPRKKSPLEALAGLFGKAVPESDDRAPAAEVGERLKAALKEARAYNDPEGAYARLPFGFALR